MTHHDADDPRLDPKNIMKDSDATKLRAVIQEKVARKIRKSTSAGKKSQPAPSSSGKSKGFGS